MTVVTARVFYVVSAFFYFHPQYQGRRHLRFYVMCEPRGARLLMLQGREINLCCAVFIAYNPLDILFLQ